MTNWAKVNRNMAGFAASMQNIYKMRQATAENKAESAKDKKDAIKGVYDDELKRLDEMIKIYDKDIADARAGGIYNKEDAFITDKDRLRTVARNKKLSLLESGVNLVDPKTMTVNYDDSVYSFDTGSSVGLGTQFKEAEKLDMAVDFFKSLKALQVENRVQMLREFRSIEPRLTKLRVKKAKSDTWDANDKIFVGGAEKTEEVYQEWLELDRNIRNYTIKPDEMPKAKERLKQLAEMRKNNEVFDDKDEPVHVDSLFPNYTKIKGTHKKSKPEAFTDSDMEEAMTYNNIAQNVVRLNDPSLSEEQISNLNFLDLNANSEEMKAYIDLMFNPEVANTLNSVMEEFKKVLESRK